MYQEDTVFILGAGASRHYGYPTGEELIQLVKEKAKEIINICLHENNNYFIQYPPKYLTKLDNDIHPAMEKFRLECTRLIQTLESVNPLVIDYFLHQHPSLQNIGKFIIGYVLLEAEALFVKRMESVLQRRASPPPISRK